MQAREEFSATLDVISEDWETFHDDYTGLVREAGRLPPAEILARLDQLIQQFNIVLEAIDGLPTAAAVEDLTETLQGAAEDELTALTEIHDGLAQAIERTPPASEETPAAGDDDVEDITEGEPESGHTVEPLLKAMVPVISGAEETLKEVDSTIKEILDRNALEDLEKVQEFIRGYEGLLAEWDTFHQRYNDWRRADGGCDRDQVLQSLGQFSTRIGELSRNVRNLPQSGYLLPMYNLLVKAAEREEGAIRTLRNSWQPFTADAPS